jgi:hypothetical protein
MLYLILVTLFLVLFFLKTTENFMPLDDTYKKDKLKYTPKEIPYSNFLIDLNNNFKSELNAVQPLSVDKGRKPLKQKVLCDDKLNIQVQKNALNKAFDKVPSTFPNLLVFEGSNDNERNIHDSEAYIKQKANEISISDENKYSNDRYNAKIDPGLKNQNNKKIIQDIKFQDDPDRNLDSHGLDDLDPCLYKSYKLSEYTNPRLYLSSDNTRFPPRWIFQPYKNTPLPKTTNLKLWTDMYNCCQNNF